MNVFIPMEFVEERARLSIMCFAINVKLAEP